VIRVAAFSYLHLHYWHRTLRCKISLADRRCCKHLVWRKCLLGIQRKTLTAWIVIIKVKTLRRAKKCPPYLAVTTDHWKIRRQCPTCPTYFEHTVIHHVCKCAFVLYTIKGIATVDIEFEQDVLVSWIHTCLTSLEMPLMKMAIQKFGKTHSSHVYSRKNCNSRYNFQLHIKGIIYKKYM